MAQDDIDILKARIAELEQELVVTNEILKEHNRVLEEVPECPLHGSQCVPHAVAWVKQAKASGIDFEARIKDALTIQGELANAKFRQWNAYARQSG
jgi:hypothetical protein